MGQGHRRLSGAGLADEAQLLSALHLQVESVERVYDLAARLVVNVQVLDLQQGAEAPSIFFSSILVPLNSWGQRRPSAHPL